jgi:hypothetical protein
MALASVDPRFAGIRVDEESKKASVYDVIVVITECEPKHAVMVFSRLEDKFTTGCGKLRINGKGRLTPVADAKTLIQIVWALPGKKARSFRVECANYICRILGGDPTLIEEMEIRARNTTEEQRQFFMTNTNVPDIELLREDERRVIAKRRIEAEIQRMEADAFRVNAEAQQLCISNFRDVESVMSTLGMDARDKVLLRDASKRLLSATTGGSPLEDKRMEISIPLVARKYGLQYTDGKSCNIGKLMKRLYVARHNGHDPVKRQVDYHGRPILENAYWSEDEDLMVAAITRYSVNVSDEQSCKADMLISSLIVD